MEKTGKHISYNITLVRFELLKVYLHKINTNYEGSACETVSKACITDKNYSRLGMSLTMMDSVNVIVSSHKSAVRSSLA